MTIILGIVILPPGASAQNQKRHQINLGFPSYISTSAGNCRYAVTAFSAKELYAKPTGLTYAAFADNAPAAAVTRSRPAQPSRSQFARITVDGSDCGVVRYESRLQDDPASFSGASGRFSGLDDIGMFSFRAVSGFGGSKLKFKVNSHSVKLRFKLDF